MFYLTWYLISTVCFLQHWFCILVKHNHSHKYVEVCRRCWLQISFGKIRTKVSFGHRTSVNDHYLCCLRGKKYFLCLQRIKIFSLQTFNLQQFTSFWENQDPIKKLSPITAAMKNYSIFKKNPLRSTSHNIWRWKSSDFTFAWIPWE